MLVDVVSGINVFRVAEAEGCWRWTISQAGGSPSLWQSFTKPWSLELSKKEERSSSDFFFSAVSLYLKDWKSHIIQSSWHYYTEQQNGMHLRNFSYILKVLYNISNSLQRSLGSYRGSLGTPYNLLLQYSNSKRKQWHESDAKILARARREYWVVMHLGRNPNFWTSSCTNGMHSGTMFVPSVSLV